MKLKFTLMTLAFFILTAFSFAERIGDLQVSSNHRTLEYKDTGKTFNWVGDTAWDLNTKINSSDMKQYLDDRKAKGFTVIQVAASGALDHGDIGIDKEGNSPFSNLANGSLNESFWSRMDVLIARAENRGMYVALLPTWGNALYEHGVNTYNYGQNLGNRYKNKKNIIWVLGGDVAYDTNKHRKIWNDLAKGIKSKDSRHLITYHANRYMDSTYANNQVYGSNSKALHQQTWLDFVMIQSGHVYDDRNKPNKKIITAYYTEPTKPLIDGEPRYEGISRTHGHMHNSDCTRSITYLHTFSGAFGHTYGHHAIWQMKQSGVWISGEGPSNIDTWKDALNSTGAKQMGYYKSFIKNYLNRVPDKSIIHSGTAIASKAVNGKYILVYLPYGTSSVTLNMHKILGDTLHYKWFNPIDGSRTDGDTIANTGTQSFTSPSASHDWVLVLEQGTNNPPACTDRAYLVAPTSGNIDSTHKFVWNKASCINAVSFYIWDDTAHKELKYYKGTAWSQTVNNLPKGHHLAIILTSYDKSNNKIGASKHYNFVVKPPIVTQKAYLVSPKNGSSSSHTTALNGTTTFSVKRYANEVIRFRIYDANSKKYLYKSGLTSSTHFAYNFAKNGHRIYIYIYSYDATRNNKYIGVNAYYNFKTATTPPKPPKITNYNAYLVYQTKGDIGTTHRFAWNKKSSVKYVSLYIWDDTAHKELKYYKGTAWSQTVKNLPKGHKITIILKAYDKYNKKMSPSNYYYFTVK